MLERRARVVISLPFGLTVGGVAKWALHLTRRLTADGRRATLVVHPSEPGYASVLDREPLLRGVDIITAPSLLDAEGWSRSLALYRALRPCLLWPCVTHTSYMLAGALVSERPRDIRVIGACRGDEWYPYAVLSHYASACSLLLAGARCVAKQLCTHLPHRRADIHHIPHGAVVGPSHPRSPRRDHPLRLIYLGRIENDNKHVGDLVDIASGLDRRGIWFDLRIVGDGPDLAALQCRVANWRSVCEPRNVLHCEPPAAAEGAADWLNWADAALLLSDHEGYGFTLVEAMLMGCVPITTRAGAAEELVRDGENGRLISHAHRVPDAVDAVAQLAQNDARLHTLSNAAHATARERCDYEGYFARICDLLASAAERPPRVWPARRPLLPQRLLAPPDAPRAISRLSARLRATAQRRVMLFGAGRHTQTLAADWRASGLTIVGVIDEDARRWGQRVSGWPVLPPDAADAASTDAIVLSHLTLEDALFDRWCDVFAARGVALHTLYSQRSTESAALEIPRDLDLREPALTWSGGAA